MKALLLAAMLLLSPGAQDVFTQSQQGPPPAQGQQTPTPTPNQSGPTLVVEEVVFEGNQVFSSAELKRQLRLVGEGGWFRKFGKRDVYTRERFQEDAVNLLKYVTDR